ncbi:MBOAT family protein [Candidatus Sumerlaeota bacterium]|nr:MBOAT family protein [Candidatus Sumerlaeota bacterium]MBI3736812.1 MBOAT family protein [Candidatus Sumerlaeota bacterium]
MKFNSLTYLVFLTTTLILYFNLRPLGRIILLVAASIFFYAFWSVPLLSLILIQSAVDFAAAQIVERNRGRWPAKAALITSMSVNLGILGFFKYANFFLDNIHALFGDSTEARVLDIVLPPGISFYTFHSMSYTIDVYRGIISPTRSYLRFFLYVMFFPQLVAGPIARTAQLLPQFDQAASRRFSMENFASGLRMIIWGMLKKCLIADYCAFVVNQVFTQPAHYDGWTALAATYAFTLQIYCDFSAYSEIARGSARMFGIELVQNFDQPYLSGDIAQFWRRWHMSLSTWFRDYLFIPLGGSQRGRMRTLFNLIVTMFLSGLWHGAAWNFVLWGLFHGLLLLIHALTSGRPGYAALRGKGGLVWSFVAWIVTLHLVVAGWILFRVHSIREAGEIFYSIGHSLALLNPPTPQQLLFFGAFALFLVASYLARKYSLIERIDRNPLSATLFYGMITVLILLYAKSEGPQFIYFQF